MTGQSQWTYVDVGVTRIQHYISRTPRLKGQRGASAWLSWATSSEQVSSVVSIGSKDGPEINPEAGEADGRVSVRIPVGINPRPVAEELAAHLRRVLPSVELSAVWGSGATYLEVYRDQFKGQREHPPLSSLPPPNEFPPLASCAECRADPAAAVIDIHEEKGVEVCLDCQARYQDRYRRPGLAAQPGPDDAERGVGSLPIYREEASLARGLGYDPVAGTAQDFAALAALGGIDTNQNHIATIYADGNAMGAFFDRVAGQGDPGLKSQISVAVSTATRQSLQRAAMKITKELPTRWLPVIPHIVGGDDLVVSVVADRAWQFITTYLNDFRERIRAIPGVPPELFTPIAPAASAGVVFAHTNFPFRRAVELAAGQMRDAKRQLCGADPAIAWLDVTRDGERRPAGRDAWALDDLYALAGALQALRTEVEPSGRAALERLVDVNRPAVSVARIAEYGRRLERDAVLAPFLSEGDPAQKAARMMGALSLVRWWR